MLQNEAVTIVKIVLSRKALNSVDNKTFWKTKKCLTKKQDTVPS